MLKRSAARPASIPNDRSLRRSEHSVGRCTHETVRRASLYIFGSGVRAEAGFLFETEHTSKIELRTRFLERSEFVSMMSWSSGSDPAKPMAPHSLGEPDRLRSAEILQRLAIQEFQSWYD